MLVLWILFFIYIPEIFGYKYNQTKTCGIPVTIHEMPIIPSDQDILRAEKDIENRQEEISEEILRVKKDMENRQKEISEDAENLKTNNIPLEKRNDERVHNEGCRIGITQFITQPPFRAPPRPGYKVGCRDAVFTIGKCVDGFVHSEYVLVNNGPYCEYGQCTVSMTEGKSTTIHWSMSGTISTDIPISKFLSKISASITASGGRSETTSTSITYTWDIKKYKGSTYIGFVPEMRVCTGWVNYIEYTSEDGATKVVYEWDNITTYVPKSRNGVAIGDYKVCNGNNRNQCNPVINTECLNRGNAAYLCSLKSEQSSIASSSTSKYPCPNGKSTNGRCGIKYGKGKWCDNQCCSRWGYCGTSNDHCNPDMCEKKNINLSFH